MGKTPIGPAFLGAIKMSGHYNLPSIQRIATDLKKEINQTVSNANLRTGEGSYKSYTYNTIQFVVAYWMTPTGLKVRFRVFKEIVSSVDEVIQIINNYWNTQRKK